MLNFLKKLGAAAALCAAAIGASPAPTPTPSPSPSAAPDPCGGDARLLATLNRPTVGFSACAVAPGTVVFEEGYQNQQQGAGMNGFLIQYPQSFVRVGVKPRLELDLIGPYFNKLAVPDGAGGLARTHGYSDSGLGFKYEFEPRGRYTVGIDGLYTAPNGSAGFSNGGATETLNLNASYAITPTFAIGTTQAFLSTSGFKADGTQARYGAWMPSAVLSTQLNDNYQLYAEYVYLNKLAPDQSGRAFVDYGVQKLLGKRFELDMELGHSLTADRGLQFQYFGVGFGWQIR